MDENPGGPRRFRGASVGFLPFRPWVDQSQGLGFICSFLKNPAQKLSIIKGSQGMIVSFFGGS